LEKNPGKFHSRSSFYTKHWKSKAVLHYTATERTCPEKILEQPLLLSGLKHSASSMVK